MSVPVVTAQMHKGKNSYLVSELEDRISMTVAKQQF